MAWSKAISSAAWQERVLTLSESSFSTMNNVWRKAQIENYLTAALELALFHGAGAPKALCLCTAVHFDSVEGTLMAAQTGQARKGVLSEL